MARGGHHSVLVDHHVGARINERRIALNLPLNALADLLGISYQQVQKYVNGKNRVGASRLFEISRVLNVPIDFFFEKIPEGSSLIEVASSICLPGKNVPVRHPEIFLTREVFELVEAYYKIKDVVVREQFLRFLVSLSGGTMGNENGK